jgi:AcrR family transcriptional regulator
MAKKQPRKTNAESSAETKTKLLDATEACLIQFGYTHTSTSKVCEKAGVSNGSLLHHYGTRSNLLVATLINIYQKIDDRIDKLLEKDEASSIDLKVYVKELFKIFDSPPMKAVIELWLAAANDDDFRRQVLPVMEAFSDNLAPRVVGYLNISQQDIEMVARITRHISILLAGYALSLIAFGRNQPGESEVRQYLEDSVLQLLTGIVDDASA